MTASVPLPRIVNQPQLVVTAPRPRPEILRFSFTSRTNPPVKKDTWATSTLLIRVEQRDTFIALIGCFQDYGEENGSRTERVLGPFSSASSAAAACTAIDKALGLPREPKRVSVAELEAEPARFHGMLIEAEGQWSAGFEHSSFAGAWLNAPRETGGKGSLDTIRIRGFWRADGGGYGHLGGSDAEIVPFSIERIADLVHFALDIGPRQYSGSDLEPLRTCTRPDVVLGSAPTDDVVTQRQGVVARHARIKKAGHRFIVEPIAGEVTINGNRIERITYADDGDRVGLGPQTIVVPQRPSSRPSRDSSELGGARYKPVKDPRSSRSYDGMFLTVATADAWEDLVSVWELPGLDPAFPWRARRIPRHRNVVAILDAFYDYGRYYVVQELPRGVSFRDLVFHLRMAQSKVPARIACAIARGFAQGIAAVEAVFPTSLADAPTRNRGIVDDQLFITPEGTPKVSRLGTRFEPGGYEFQSVRDVGGALVYTADTFFGYVLWELLTGQSLLPAEIVDLMVDALPADFDVTKLRSAPVTGVPAKLDAFVRSALVPGTYATAQSFLGALDVLCAEHPELHATEAEIGEYLDMEGVLPRKPRPSSTAPEAERWFYEKLRDAPEDEVTTAVYADWLETNGHPARAAFLRSWTDDAGKLDPLWCRVMRRAPLR